MTIPGFLANCEVSTGQPRFGILGCAKGSHTSIPLALAIAVVAIGCASVIPRPLPPVRGEADGDDSRCVAVDGDHILFSILVDGRDVGREVRTTFRRPGKAGLERLISSHAVRRMKMGNIHVDTHTIRMERTTEQRGLLLAGSHVHRNQVKEQSADVSLEGDEWNRMISSQSLVTGQVYRRSRAALSLTGNEIIGFRLVDALHQRMSGRCTSPFKARYYEPLLDRSVPIELSCPRPGDITVHRQTIRGNWVAAMGEDGQEVMRAFFDLKGRLWEEHIPAKHEVARRIPGPLTLADETTELIIGLHSETYLPNPNDASRALFRLISTPDRLDAMELLEEPLNQVFVEKTADHIVLEVRAGAPDGDTPPTKVDLGSSQYIQPDRPEIVAAYRYLRSAGKRGQLSKSRQDNATGVIARASLIQKPARFWSDPVRVAGLMMDYVSAVLPNKQHTFSMADAATTLERGAGDCTEHAVLFASLMRAHGIPARLVTGMILTRGGLWGYHMWNSYWDGSAWQSIDPSTASFHPGALHVALGRGASRFADVRNRLADFMWRTFNGVAFNLIEADDEGETLFLVRPRGVGEDLQETALFNSMVLYDRGDIDGAIRTLDEKIPSDRRPLSIRVKYAELLVHAKRFERALELMSGIRDETSEPGTIALLDRLTLKSLLQSGRGAEAAGLFDRVNDRLPDDAKVPKILLRLEYLHGLERTAELIQLAQQSVEVYPEDPDLLTAFAHYVTNTDAERVSSLIDRAVEAAYVAVLQTKGLEQDSLVALARVLLKIGRIVEAGWYVDQALILTPQSAELHRLRDRIRATHCYPD